MLITNRPRWPVQHQTQEQFHHISLNKNHNSHGMWKSNADGRALPPYIAHTDTHIATSHWPCQTGFSFSVVRPASPHFSHYPVHGRSMLCIPEESVPLNAQNSCIKPRICHHEIWHRKTRLTCLSQISSQHSESLTFVHSIWMQCTLKR